MTRTNGGLPSAHRIRSFLPKREIFGAPECPLMYRWKIAGGEQGKLMLHWFLPGRAETDTHDHPRDFVTIVLFGSYLDMAEGGTVDVVQAPAARFRRAAHAHRTVAGPHGCLTLCFLGRRQREWGFFRDGRWFGWRDYERRFGSRFRCE